MFESDHTMSRSWDIDWKVDEVVDGASVGVNSLSMQRESLSSRIRNSFCCCKALKDNFFLNRVD